MEPHYYPCPWLIGVAEQCHYRWEIEKEKSEQNYNSRVTFLKIYLELFIAYSFDRVKV